MTMKEKINRFFAKGWHFLAFAWINVAFLCYTVIDSLLEGLFFSAFTCFLFHIPWVLLFIKMYKHHKTQVRTEILLDVLNKIFPAFKRYHELYGELPEEETENEPERKEKNNE